MKIIKCEQRTEEWYEVRRGVFTASEFSKLVTPTGKASTSLKDFVVHKVAEELAEKREEDYSSEWMDRGAEIEDEARRAYEIEVFESVDTTGFFLSDGYGCSPDGLIGKDGLLEIKCLKQKNHIKNLIQMDKKYIPQVQGQLLVSEREWCDLVFYNPDFKEDYRLAIYRIPRDEEYIEKLKEALEVAVGFKRVILNQIKKGQK